MYIIPTMAVFSYYLLLLYLCPLHFTEIIDCHKAEVNFATLSLGDIVVFKIVVFVCLSMLLVTHAYLQIICLWLFYYFFSPLC